MEYLNYGQIGYGQSLYADEAKAGGEDATCVDLLRYLPPYWYVFREMVVLQRSLGCQLGRFLYDLKDVKRQRFVDSATWGLALWEKDYGLLVDPEKSDAFRRERLKAKARGNGTTTKQAIINMASAFAGGEAEIQEYPQDSRFVVKFTGVKGIPANMQDLTASIEEIKPAHLACDYAYTYNWWNALQGKVWNDLRPMTWEQVRTI